MEFIGNFPLKICHVEYGHSLENVVVLLGHLLKAAMELFLEGAIFFRQKN
jgi:hypothetical protein